MSAAERLPPDDVDTFHLNSVQSLRKFFPGLQLQALESFEYEQAYHCLYNCSDEAGQGLITNRLKSMLPCGLIYVHTSPCKRALRLAVDLATALNSEQISALVRVDDRLPSCCLPSRTERVVVLESLLSYLQSNEEKHSFWQSVDELWLDRRLYTIETAVAAEEPTIVELLGDKDYQRHSSRAVGLVTIGEVDVCAPFLQAKLFTWSARHPRECEIYHIARTGTEWQRRYAGAFTRRPNLEDHASRTAFDATAQDPHTDPLKRPASPLVSQREKRALNSPMTPDGSS